MEKTKIICVVGATASGKSALGIEIAKAIGGEIISADSMQVYKYMPVATAVVTEEEAQGIPHHLVEYKEPDEVFSVADFVSQARIKIDEICKRGNVPIIVGGTGLFVDSLVKNIEFSDVSADNELRQEYERYSNDELYAMLKEADEKAANDIHPNNRKRVIRALELCSAGISKTAQNEASTLNESPYEALYIGIGYKDRERLYERINLRVDIMMKNGLEQEARRMSSRLGSTSRQAIGHKELMPYIEGKCSLEQAVESLKQATRRYAKRQLTWFRKNENINWLYADELSSESLVEKAVCLSKDFLKSR